MRTIAVFTATRADYGLLRPVLLRLREAADCHLRLLVSGTHLSPLHGHTLGEILADGFTPDATIPLVLDDDAPAALCGVMGHVVTGVGQAISRQQPDLLLLLGDRYECLGAAAAAAMCTVPVAHISGGEITRGANDDAFRHAVTKLAHLHFTSCEPYRRRVIQMGEAPERVWNVGALGVENALRLPLWDEARIRAELGLAPGRPYFLCTFHPVTLEPGDEDRQLDALCSALAAFPDHAVIFTGANADAGGLGLNDRLKAFTQANPDRVRLFASLGVMRYLSAAKYAACVAGNSSSGIIEVPSLGTPVVNIGSRQRGRIASSVVLHCPAEEEAVATCLRRALSSEHRALARVTPNPYEGKDTSAAIARILMEHPLENILRKNFHDIAAAALGA